MASTRHGGLRAATLSPGDTLVKADTSSWGDLIHTIDLTVEKVTASRVTLRYPYGDSTIVLMVKDGVVTDRIYGRSDRISDRANVYTPDDQRLAALRERREAENLKAEAKRAISAWQSYSSDRTKAREAVAALQAWIDAAAVIDAKESP